MKIVALNGSHKRVGGNTQLIIDQLLAGAADRGATTETIRLSACEIRSCLACDSCQKKAFYTCVQDSKDDFVKIIENLRTADIIVFATPIYVFQMSSKLRTFFERIYGRGKSKIKKFSKANLFFHDVDNETLSKPFVSIITSSNMENLTTHSTELFFKAYSAFMDAPQVGSIVRNGWALLRRESQNELDGKLERILSHVHLAGCQLAIQGFISRKTEKRIRVNSLPLPKPVFNMLKMIPKAREKILEISMRWDDVKSDST
jgi:multimeric flavodoxin WrbA